MAIAPLLRLKNHSKLTKKKTIYNIIVFIHTGETNEKDRISRHYECNLCINRLF